jgi:hypothetical protein
LASAIETPSSLGFDGDAEVGHGVEMRPGVWKPPETITEDDLKGARLWLKAFEMEDQPAEPGAVEKWIMMLIAGMNHSMTADTLNMRVSALVFAVMDRPAFCFTVDTQRQAQAKFGFVPTSKELIDFCAAVEADERTTAKRLFKVCDTGARRPGRPGTEGKIDIEASMQRMRDKQAAENQELAKKLGVQPVRVAPRMLGETDREYGRRIALAAMRLCDEGTKALKRDVAKLQRAKLDAAREAMNPKEPEPAESTEQETEA